MDNQQIIRVLLINNYSKGRGEERLKRLQESMKSFYSVVQIFYYDKIPVSQVKAGDFDCLVLSGSDLNVSDKSDREKMTTEINLLKEIKIPVLAICFGFHLLVYAYGGKIERNKNSGEFGESFFPFGKEILIDIKDDPNKLICCSKIAVNVNHKDYVLPNDPQLNKSFEIYSVSTDKDKKYVQYVKHKEKMIFGVQFHPESFNDATQIVQDVGQDIIHNFLSITNLYEYTI